MFVYGPICFCFENDFLTHIIIYIYILVYMRSLTFNYAFKLFEHHLFTQTYLHPDWPTSLRTGASKNKSEYRGKSSFSFPVISFKTFNFRVSSIRYAWSGLFRAFCRRRRRRRRFNLDDDGNTGIKNTPSQNIGIYTEEKSNFSAMFTTFFLRRTLICFYFCSFVCLFICLLSYILS